MKGLSRILAFLTLSVAILCAAHTVKAYASVTYDPVTDSITSSEDGYLYPVKAETGNTIKGGAAGRELTADEPVKLVDLKYAVNKDAFFYFSKKAIEDKKEGVSANVKIYKTKVKSAKCTVNYIMADYPSAAAERLFRWVITDTTGGSIAADKMTLLWSENDVDYYYTDSTEYKLNGAYLAEKILNGTTIFLRLADSKNNIRVSKTIKVKIAKQAAAPDKLKLDVKKDTIALKNGYDFRCIEFYYGYDELPDELTASDFGPWHTILPYNKGAGITKNQDSIVLTSQYKTLAPKDDKALEAKTKAYTSVKYASISTLELASFLEVEYLSDVSNYRLDDGELWLTSGFYFQVRKSATATKPASATATYRFWPRAENPIMYTENCVMYDQVIAEGETADFVAKTIVKTTARNEETGKYWNGIGSEAEPAAEESDDTAPAVFEFCVVNSKDMEKIDWSTVGWKSIKAGTKITSGKLSTKYKLMGSSTAVTAVYLQSDAAAGMSESEYCTFENSDKIKTYILIRRAGVKGTTISDSMVASEPLITWLSKKKVDGKTTYAWMTCEWNTVGEEAYKYNVEIIDWAKGTKNGDKDYAWRTVETITGYRKKGEKFILELPEVENGYYKEILYEKLYEGRGSRTVYDSTFNDRTITVTASQFVSADKIPEKTMYVERKRYGTLRIVSAINHLKKIGDDKYEADEDYTIVYDSSCKKPIIVGEEAYVYLTAEYLGLSDEEYEKIFPSKVGYNYSLAYIKRNDGKGSGYYLSTSLKHDKGYSLSAYSTTDNLVKVRLDTEEEMTMYMFYDEFVNTKRLYSITGESFETLVFEKDPNKTYVDGTVNVEFPRGTRFVNPEKITVCYSPAGEDDDEIITTRFVTVKDDGLPGSDSLRTKVAETESPKMLELRAGETMYAVVTSRTGHVAGRTSIYEILYDYKEAKLNNDSKLGAPAITFNIDGNDKTFTFPESRYNSEYHEYIATDAIRVKEGTELVVTTEPQWDDEKVKVDFGYSVAKGSVMGLFGGFTGCNVLKGEAYLMIMVQSKFQGENNEQYNTYKIRIIGE